MEASLDRNNTIPNDDFVQDYAETALYTVREFGTQFWSWCGHTKERLEEFLHLKEKDDLHENWVQVDSQLEMTMTETPEQHFLENMARHSYGSPMTTDEKDDELRRIYEEKNRLSSQMNDLTVRYRDLESKLQAYEMDAAAQFKNAEEVHHMMDQIVPNQFTAAIEYLESAHRLDPDCDTLPYTICLNVFRNCFVHSAYRQRRFFEIIRENSVFKIDMNVAQKLFWGLVQDHFELIGMSQVDDIVNGILAVTQDEHEDCEQFSHFYAIDMDEIEDVLQHRLMREYISKCIEISFFVLWSKNPQLELTGWELTEDDSVFDEGLHDRIWGDDVDDNHIQAVAFPVLCQLGENGESIPLTRRYVFCSGTVD